MKKIIIYLVCLVATGVWFSSCDEYLDTPPDNRTELTNKENIQLLLTNAYINQGSTHLCAEFSSDNVDCNIRSNWNYYQLVEEQVYNWADVTEKSWESPQWIWDSHYSAIAHANLALDAINQLGNTKDLAPLRAEALLCRAYAHFMLLNIFSMPYKNAEESKNDMGIVYMDTVSGKVNTQYERPSVAEVYEKIEQDIEEALPLTDDAIFDGRPKQWHFNRKAAYAFATRFYLYYHKYDKVIEYASEVLSDNPVEDMHDWQALGDLDPWEGTQRNDAYLRDDASLLEISVNSLWGRISGPYTIGMKYAHNLKIATTETIASGTPWGSLSSISHMPGIQLVAEYSKYLFSLYSEYFRITDPIAQVGTPYIIEVPFTTDETLLCRAEAYIMQENYDAAVADLNAFMNAFTSSGTVSRINIYNYYNNMKYFTPMVPTAKKVMHPYVPFASGEQECFLQCVLHLRRVLTMYTGLRWYDVKRYGIEIQRRRVEGTSTMSTLDNELLVNDPRRAIQLPQDVIYAGMTPNPR